MTRARVPLATYRLQLHADFGFDEARAVVPYLRVLGIGDLYASPVLQARRGSRHGYDVADPTRLSAELGGEEGFRALAGALRQEGMGLLLDIVPNHMAASGENPWWRDVLEHGPASPYARYFDVEWRSGRPGLADKVLLPILGAPYGQVLEAGELKVALDADGFAVRYYDWRLPLNPASYATLLGADRAARRPESRTRRPGLRPALQGGGVSAPSAPGASLEHSPESDSTDAAPRELRELVDAITEGERGVAALARARRRVWEVYQSSPAVRCYVDETLAALNGRPWEPGSFDALDSLLADQAYRLAYWRTASQELNYRRFFDVSDLVAVRIEDPDVFRARHATLLRLVAAGQVAGLRVDHVDGLYDPAAYLARLQAHLPVQEPSGEPPEPHYYVVVEKILAADEALPHDWLVAGTTGYDFLNLVNGLFVDGRAAASLTELYHHLTGDDAAFEDVARACKRLAIESLFGGEVRALVERLVSIARADRHGRDLPRAELVGALVEVTACLPVYRTYVRDESVAPADRARVEWAVAEAQARRPDLAAACALLRRVLLLEWPASLDAAGREAWRRFVGRWQQLTGPATAKGVEDTALYRYTRLLSLNDVGGDPGRMGTSVADFHRQMQERRARWPHTLNATATHDTKRGEDVRMRIDVLSEIPHAWAGRLERWRRWNEPKLGRVGDQHVPDGRMELLLYQTLLGAWPLDEAERPAFRERLRAYLEKAAREAKTHTSWHDPNVAYEGALLAFAEAILDPLDGSPFLADFVAFQRPIAYYGALNSLGQVLLKATAPGVPDFYQGSELWDLSLVDPDNRRPVDYARRAALLAALPDPERADAAPALADLLARWEDGRVKLYLTRQALRCRRAYAALFAAGDYQPVPAAGRREAHVCAFLRRHGDAAALVVVPRLLARLALATAPAPDAGELPPTGLPLGEAAWADTHLRLPAAAPRRWRSTLTGETLEAPAADASAATTLRLADLLRTFPVALLVADE